MKLFINLIKQLILTFIYTNPRIAGGGVGGGKRISGQKGTKIDGLKAPICKPGHIQIGSSTGTSTIVV